MANLQQIIPAFFTGPNGQQLTPEQIAQRQEVAKSLLQQASDTSPNAGGWASVLAKGLQGGIAGYQQGRADDAAALNAKTDQANIEAGLGSIFGGGIAPVGGVGGAFPSAVAAGASPTSGVATGTGVSLPGDLGSIINEAAGRYNVDPAALSVIAQIESGGNINAKNPNSSAGGPFQFIDSTAKQYGLQDRFDPVQASDAAARLTRDNAAVLTKALGRAPTAGELYLAHQQGSGGAAKLLSNPNARAIDIVGRDAVRLNGGDENMTALSFANKWINKADKLMGTPQQAIQAVAPIEQGDENPMAGIAHIAQAGNAYVDPIVAPIAGGGDAVFNQDNFANRFGDVPPAPAPMPMAPETQQQPQIDSRLAALNDQMLGGALSPTGRSEVAQALTGYFPEAPGQMQNSAMSQAPMQQPTGGVNPQIIASLLGPNSSPQARQVGALLLGHHQQQQAAKQAQQQAQQELAQRQQVAQSMGIDPNAAMDVEAWKAAVAKANRDRSTVTVGNTVIDANTMQPIYEGTPENPTSVQEYEYGVRTPGYFERQESLRRAGANSVTTNVGGESDAYQKKFDESMGAATAKTFTDAMDAGDIARRSRINLDRISQLASSTPQGFEGATIRALGEYGIKTEGLDKVQAMESLISQMVPSQRPPGSGTISDADLALYKASLPRLINSPEGNNLILETLYAINDHDIAASDIAARVASREITPTEARKLMRQIPNPFDDWRDKVDLMSGGSSSGSKTKTGVTWSVN